MIKDMVQLTVFGPKDSYQTLLDVAWELDCLHLVDIEAIDLDMITIPEVFEGHYKYDLSKMEEFDLFFGTYQDRLADPDMKIEPIDQGQTTQFIQQLEGQISNWKRQMTELQDKSEVYSRYETILEEFQGIVPDLPVDGLLEARGIILRNTKITLRSALENKLDEYTNGMYQLNLYPVSSDLVLGLIVYPKEFSIQILQLLEAINIAELNLPSSIAGGSLADRIEKLMKEQVQIKTSENRHYIILQEIYLKFLRLKPYYTKLRQEVAKIQGLEKFRQSQYFTIFTAFTSEEEVFRVREALEKLIPDIYIHEQYDIPDAPTKISNPHGIKEFEVFTQLLPPLTAKSVDPTVLMAIFFPIFYGFIVGDIGYGIIITLIGWYFYQVNHREGNETLSRLGWVFVLSGTCSIIFGILFGEFFGNFAEEVGIHPLWFHRGHDLLTLLIIAIGIGVVHITLGLILGIYNAFIVSHLAAMRGSLGMLLVVLAIGLFGASFLFSLSSPVIPIIGGLITAFGLYYLLKGEGVIGIIEIISTIANMLSYARLMALGAASVILADLANEMYMIAGGGISGLLITVAIHVLNIGIAMFSPTIHSMRLHLVEFFNKFLEYGTTSYIPFGPTTQLGGM